MPTVTTPRAGSPRLPETRPPRRRAAMLWAIVGLVLAGTLGVLVVAATSAVTSSITGQQAYAPMDCPAGGSDFYNNSQVTASIAAIRFGTDEVTWQPHEGASPSGDAVVQRTPYEWYGAYFPFTSSYHDSEYVPAACGTVEGWMGATIPSLLFTIGSALSTLLIAVYSWSTNPDLLNSLIAPIDCVVAGPTSVSPDANIGLDFGDYGGSSASRAFANADPESTCHVAGLRDTFFLQWWVLIFFFGALWMLWQAIAKKRTSQALIGALWMIGAAAGALVFLWQPTFLATTANDLIARVNNTLISSVLSATDGEQGSDPCYLDNDSAAIEDLTNRIPGFAQELANGSQFSEEMVRKWATGSTSLGIIGPRRATCVLWKTLVFDAWTQGQFGDYTGANQELDPAAIQIDLDKTGDEEQATQRAAQRTRLMQKFPHLKPEVSTTLGMAQIDATVLDHDELIAMSYTPDPRYVSGQLSTSPNDIVGCIDMATGDEVDVSKCGNAPGIVATTAERDFRAIFDQVANSPENAGWAPIWSGRVPAQRYAAAITAIVGSLLGGIVVFVLGFLNILYQVGMLLLIVVGPLILLVGLHPGFGRRITIRWLEALLSTVTKRILISVLLVILIAVYSAIYTMDIGWLQKTLLLAAVGIGLLLYRKQLTQMMGAVNFGGGGGDSFSGGAQQATRRGGRMVSSGAGATGAALLGGAGIGAAAAAGARAATSRSGGVNMPGSEGFRTGRAAAARAQMKRDRKRRQRRQDQPT